MRDSGSTPNWELDAFMVTWIKLPFLPLMSLQETIALIFILVLLKKSGPENLRTWEPESPSLPSTSLSMGWKSLKDGLGSYLTLSELLLREHSLQISCLIFPYILCDKWNEILGSQVGLSSQVNAEEIWATVTGTNIYIITILRGHKRRWSVLGLVAST